jgi:hypothetical protein
MLIYTLFGVQGLQRTNALSLVDPAAEATSLFGFSETCHRAEPCDHSVAVRVWSCACNSPPKGPSDQQLVPCSFLLPVSVKASVIFRA